MKTIQTLIVLLVFAGRLTAAVPLQALPAADVQKNLELFRLDPKYAGDYRSYADGRFNLKDLPAYQPRQTVSGWIKIHGAATLAQGRLARLWEEGFTKFHPDVHFSYYLPTTEVALTPLYYHQADISLVHELGFYDILPYERVLNSQPPRIADFNRSFDIDCYAAR